MLRWNTCTGTGGLTKICRDTRRDSSAAPSDAGTVLRRRDRQAFDKLMKDTGYKT